MAGLLVKLVGSARSAAGTPLDAGIFGALLACCLHNVVDFNWQIPANAATFVALAGLAVRRGAEVRLRVAPPIDSNRGAA
jgi:hypothetical protein